jgi:hypothetical protein
MNTVFTISQVDQPDTPWITICQNPGVDFNRWEDYLIKHNISVTTFLTIAPTGLDWQTLRILAQEGINLSEFIEDIAVPIWMKRFRCSVGEGLEQRNCLDTFGSPKIKNSELQI